MSHDLHPGDSLRHTANAELSCRARASLEVASGTIFPWDGEARSQPEVAAYISSAACLASPRRPAAPSEAETESKGQPQPGAHCPGFIYSGVKGESDKELQMLKNMGFEKSQRLAGFFSPSRCKQISAFLWKMPVLPAHERGGEGLQQSPRDTSKPSEPWVGSRGSTGRCRRQVWYSTKRIGAYKC